MVLIMKTQNLQQENWYVIDSELKNNCSLNNRIKFLTSSLESSLYDYSDAYILVTGNINVTGGDANTKVAFKSCASFKEGRTEINKIFVDNAENTNIAMPMYNLTECSDNRSDNLVVYGSLREMK